MQKEKDKQLAIVEYTTTPYSDQEQERWFEDELRRPLPLIPAWLPRRKTRGNRKEKAH